MRGRLLLAKWGLLVGSGIASAQLPRAPEAPPLPPIRPQAPPLFPASPAFPQNPASLPPMPLPPLRPATPAQSGLPGGSGLPSPGAANPFPRAERPPIAQALEIRLPQPENKLAINPADVTLKRVVGGWQLWAGHKVLRDFGDREADARDALRVYRDLRPTEWVTIGGPKPVVEYGLVNGRAPGAVSAVVAPDPQNPTGGAVGVSAGGRVIRGEGAKVVVPIDLKTVRVEAVRGVWCLRDDHNIHFNFGTVKAEAEQALAVVQRYGFNRIGLVGAPAPAMTYFFVGQDDPQKYDRGPFAKAALQGQIDGLKRVGIPVPGVGFVGEMVSIDPRKLEVRKDGAEWVVVSGTETLGRYGPGEWAARDAARTLADARFTEFCKVGSAGLTFFLADGKAPRRVPFSAQGRRFDPASLKVRQLGQRWSVTENNRHLFDCASAEEGETLIRVVQHFGFDQLCHLGPTPKLGVSFLAKGQ